MEPNSYHVWMKQLITRVDESLAAAVKERARLTGESMNAFVTRLLNEAVRGRRTWKSEAIAAGRLISRVPVVPPPAADVSTPPGYASYLVSAERDDR